MRLWKIGAGKISEVGRQAAVTQAGISENTGWFSPGGARQTMGIWASGVSTPTTCAARRCTLSRCSPDEVRPPGSIQRAVSVWSVPRLGSALSRGGTKSFI